MKRYTGTAYIGVTEGDTQYGVCRDSIGLIAQRPGDIGPYMARATKGYDARQQHITQFLASKAEWLLMLDGDMIFQPDCLERLREHGLPYVSGLYMRRTFNPLCPIWFKTWAGAFPYEPWLQPIEKGRLYEIGASGWGLVLIHREVIMAVRNILCGEWEVLEDDMDIWPYSLPVVMAAITGLRNAGNLEDTRPHVATLEQQIRPLHGMKAPIGSDVRFPHYALACGYQLYGDPDCRADHVINYPVSANDYDAVPAELREKVAQQNLVNAAREREDVVANLFAMGVISG